MTNALVPYSEVKEMASVAAKSGLFPGARNAETATALMLLAQAEGIHPMSAMRRYHVIEGQPSMRADAMLASHYAAGGTVQWLVSSDTECRAVFTSPSSKLEVAWTIDDAKRAGVAGKQNWTKYPRQMLRARCISEGIRAVSPGVVCGIYTPEEVQDFDSEPADPAPEPRRVTVASADVAAEPASDKPIADDLAAMRTALAELYPALSDSKEHQKVAAGKWMDFCSRHAGRTIKKATDLTAQEVRDIMVAISAQYRAEPGCDDDKEDA